MSLKSLYYPSGEFSRPKKQLRIKITKPHAQHIKIVKGLDAELENNSKKMVKAQELPMEIEN